MADSSIGNEDQDRQGQQSFDALANPQTGRKPAAGQPGETAVERDRHGGQPPAKPAETVVRPDGESPLSSQPPSADCAQPQLHPQDQSNLDTQAQD